MNEDENERVYFTWEGGCWMSTLPYKDNHAKFVKDLIACIENYGPPDEVKVCRTEPWTPLDLIYGTNPNENP